MAQIREFKYVDGVRTLFINGIKQTDSPFKISGAQTVTLYENIDTSPDNTGFSVSATNADSDAVTFMLDDARFEIVSGAVKVKAAQLFDFETDNGKKITITGTDDGSTNQGGAKTHTQQFTLTVVDINETPQLVRSTLTASPHETVVLNNADLLVTDADVADSAANLTYTITNASASTGVLQKLSAASWATLANADTFTQADVNAGNIRFVTNAGIDIQNPSFTFTVADGGENAVKPIRVTLATGIRTVEKIADEAAPNTVRLATEIAPKIITTGDANDDIIAGKGNDQINAGLGSDKVDLSAGGVDNVVYTFGAGGTAADGSDAVTSFKRGEDKLSFKESKATTTTATTIEGFLASARGTNLHSLDDDLFIVTPNYELDTDVFYITGVTFNFREAGVYNGNKISGGLLNVTFVDRIAWADFLKVIGGAEQVDFDLFALKDPSALVSLLGENSFDFVDYDDATSTATPDII